MFTRTFKRHNLWLPVRFSPGVTRDKMTGMLIASRSVCRIAAISFSFCWKYCLYLNQRETIE